MKILKSVTVFHVFLCTINAIDPHTVLCTVHVPCITSCINSVLIIFSGFSRHEW